MMRSTAFMKSARLTNSFSLRAAIRAASLQMFAMSAPENPGVWRASKSRSRLLSVLIFFRWTVKISLRSLMSGRSTNICLSNRPARVRAPSRISTRFVAARMMIPLLEPNPSISVRSWLSVFSRSSFPPRFCELLLARPTASISSMKTIQGAFSLALAKRSLTRLAPTPTNISTKSEPDREKNGTCASPATAFASRVLPVPGGPTRRAPLGILAPSCVYLFGFFKKCTISSTSSLASCRPATSAKVMDILFLSCSLALLCPTEKIPPPPSPPEPLPPIERRIIQNQNPTRSRVGPKERR